MINKIKFILYIVISCFSANSALSDICYDIKEDIIIKATEILKQQKEIYKYCSICTNAVPQKIIIKEITPNNPILVNGEPLDLAHTYYKEQEKFVNLGISSGCITPNEYEIEEKLEKLPEIHRTKESAKAEAKEKTEKIYNTCFMQYNNEKKHVTTSDMASQNILINDCLAQRIELEISKGFDQDIQKEMYQNVKQLRKNALNFYNKLYSQNKYCNNQCGSISTLLPYIDENNLLISILEQLLYLNITRNGY